MQSTDRFICKWCTSRDEVAQAVRLFVENADIAYISHGEVQSARAENFSKWSGDLSQVLQKEFGMCLEESADSEKFRLALSYVDDGLVGILYVQEIHETTQPYAILQDLIVARDYRGQRLGKRMLLWLEDYLRENKINLLFMESGINNHRAHAFFEENGFEVCSKILVKDLK